MSQSSIRLWYGPYPMIDWTVEERKEALALLKKHNITDLDSASAYPENEKILGQLGAPKEFTIATKAFSFVPGSLKRTSLLSNALLSFWELKVDHVDTYFLHSPDPETPIAETLGAINELYLAGKFTHFGLSNFLPDQVQEAYDTAKEKGYVLPTVFQGNYNPVARKTEQTLFPLLRKLGIRFYAYSPLAGGFLVRTASQITEGTKGGRFDKDSFLGKMYHGLYNRPTLLAALEKWEAIAKEAGCTQASLAYRWVAYNSILNKEDGDGMIIGASRISQLEQTLKGIEDGPLPATIVKKIDEIWEMVKDEAPLDNLNQ